MKQRALFERKKKEEEYFVSEKLLKNTTQTHKRGKKTTSSSFYLPSQNLTLAFFALAVFTHALLRRRFDRDHDFFFKSFDDDVCSFSGLNVRCWFFCDVFLFYYFFFPSTLVIQLAQ